MDDNKLIFPIFNVVEVGIDTFFEYSKHFLFVENKVESVILALK